MHYSSEMKAILNVLTATILHTVSKFPNTHDYILISWNTSISETQSKMQKVAIVWSSLIFNFNQLQQ